MSYINWGNETPEQLARRRQLEEESLYEQAAQTVRARSGQSPFGGAGGSSAGGTIYIEWYYSFFDEGVPSEFYIPGYWTYLLTNDGEGGTYNQGLQATAVSIEENLPGGVFRTSITLNAGLELRPLLFSLGKKPATLIKSFLDPEGLVFAAGYAVFSNSDGLETVSLPGCYNFYGYAVFSYCDSLSSVYLPKLTVTTGLSFYQCTSLTTIDLPNLSYAGGEDFYGCSALESANLPSAVNLQSSTFSNCSSLTSIELPSAISIYNSCFSNCSALESVYAPKCINLGNSVLDDQVFYGIDPKPFTLTIGASRRICNNGRRDGDISALYDSMQPNPVTINYIE